MLGRQPSCRAASTQAQSARRRKRRATPMNPPRSNLVTLTNNRSIDAFEITTQRSHIPNGDDLHAIAEGQYTGFFSRAKPHGLPDPLRDDDLKLWRNGHCFHGSYGMAIDAQIKSYFRRTRVVAPDSTPPQAGPPPQSLQTPMESLIPGGSGIGPERALERPHPDPVSAIARKLLLSPRSLRAQDRSRGAPPATQPHRQTNNTATQPAPARSPQRPTLTHDASDPLRVICRK
jgi:hypothetical protein